MVLGDYRIQESPAIADKPARRESLPKIAPIRRAYNVVADNTGLTILAYLHSFSCCCVRNLRNPAKFTKKTYGVQGHPRSSILVSMESPYVTSY